MPSAWAAESTSRFCGSASTGAVGLTSKANTPALGSNSCSNSSRFGAISSDAWVTPVTLPPGRLRLATSPILTGSAAVSKTIGMVLVAAFAASVAGDEVFVLLVGMLRRGMSLHESAGQNACNCGDSSTQQWSHGRDAQRAISVDTRFSKNLVTRVKQKNFAPAILPPAVR